MFCTLFYRPFAWWKTATWMQKKQKHARIQQISFLHILTYMMRRVRKKIELWGTVRKNNFSLPCDISLFDSFVWLFDINVETRISEDLGYMQLWAFDVGLYVGRTMEKNKNEMSTDDIIKWYLIRNCYCVQVLVVFLSRIKAVYSTPLYNRVLTSSFRLAILEQNSYCLQPSSATDNF